MPLEIRELVIRATLEQLDQTNGQNNSGASGSSSGNDTEMIVKMCIEKVMEILKERNER